MLIVNMSAQPTQLFKCVLTMQNRHRAVSFVNSKANAILKFLMHVCRLHVTQLTQV